MTTPRPCPECGKYGDHHPLCPNADSDDETSGETREPDDDDATEDDES